MAQLTFESTEYITQREFAVWLGERGRWDLNRYELLNGRVVMNPPAGYPHGSVEGRVAAVLSRFVQEHALGEYLGSSQGFELPSGDTVEPDHSYVSSQRWNAMPAPQEGKFLQVVPDLIVEILSPSTASRDRGEKKGIYELNGVREYWLVDARAREVVVLTLREGAFDQGARYASGETLASSVLSGLRVEVTSLFPGR
jgi:Uma2 family endonuclease